MAPFLSSSCGHSFDAWSWNLTLWLGEGCLWLPQPPGLPTPSRGQCGHFRAPEADHGGSDEGASRWRSSHPWLFSGRCSGPGEQGCAQCTPCPPAPCRMPAHSWCLINVCYNKVEDSLGRVGWSDERGAACTERLPGTLCLHVSQSEPPAPHARAGLAVSHRPHPTLGLTP